MMNKLLMDANPMPTKHQFFCLMIATVAAFIVETVVKKGYLSLWSRKGR